MQMNPSELLQTVDTLETFLLLKKQNMLIYAWMELKKRHRKIASIRGSRTKSIYDQSASSKHSGYQQRPSAPYQPNQLVNTKSQNRSTPKIVRKELRLATQHLPANQAEGFDTFHKKQQGNRLTFTEKNTQRDHPIANQEDIEDSDQFEDIVLDRLSKLEENINRLMREKKLKEEKRGYVGTPLSNPHQTPHVYYQTQFQQPARERQNFASILERKKKFFQSLQNGQEEDNVVYNLKYIPVGREQPNNANIQKIKHIFQQHSEEDNFIDNVDYFINANPRHYHHDQPHEKENGHERDRGSSSLYMRRYGNRKEGDSQVHYIPNHIEMQTVIEPPRKRYFHRESFNSNRTNIKEEELKRSNVSRNSDYQPTRNNLSSYY